MRTNRHPGMASVSAMAAIVCLALSAPCRAQQKVNEDVREYSRVQIAALALALEAPGLADQLDPKPSEAMERLVRIRPDSLLTWDAGETWNVRLADQDGIREVDAERFPLQPYDVSAADAILRLPYIEQWVSCLADAWAGKAGGECIIALASEATSVDDAELRAALLADIGARVIALAPRNEEWEMILYAKGVPHDIELALNNYRALEERKVQAALKFDPDATQQGSAITFEPAVADSSAGPEILWGDFAMPNLEQSKEERRLISWASRPDGSIRPIRNRSELERGRAHSLWLSKDRHVIVVGTLDEKKSWILRNSESLEDLFQNASDWNVELFLSRPGSSSLGVVPLRR